MIDHKKTAPYTHHMRAVVRLFWVPATVLFLVPRTGHALEVPASAYCVLDRSPMVLEQSLPEALRCQFDQDGNGLDDAIEEQLAHCFAPRILLDSAENVTSGSEPASVFTARRSAPNEIVLQMGLLWHNDGGFVLDGSIGCTDAHEGDAERVTVTVAFTKGATNWLAYPVRFKADDFIATLDGANGTRVLNLHGTHPNLWGSAGKHHWYLEPVDTTYEVSLGIDCRDRANGGFPTPLTPGEGTRPLTHVAAQQVLVGYYQTTDTEGNVFYNPQFSFLNVCSWAKGSANQVQLNGFQPESLSNLGFNGQSLFSFYSGEVTPPWTALKQPLVADIDADGRPELVTFTPNYPPALPIVQQPTDRCPFGDDESDPDGDQVFGACDPDSAFTNTYVAGGSSVFPAYHADAVSAPDAWRRFEKEAGFSGPYQGPRQGFLDADSDGYVDGEDLCPETPSLADHSDTNVWAEDALLGTSPGSKDLGRFYRGDACDPYPVATIAWRDSGSSKFDSSVCSILNYARGGTDSIRLDTGILAGRSANDPNRNQADTRTFNVQAYRCACSSGGVDCLKNPLSPCFREVVQQAAGSTPAGRGWRPVQRDGCTRDSSGFCQSWQAPNGQARTIQWAWREETTAFPSHFASGDVLGASANPNFLSRAPETSLRYDYALWSQALNGASFTQAPGAGLAQVSRFPEPEQTSGGAELLSISSQASRNFRSSFATAQPVRAPWSTFLGFGGVCLRPPTSCATCPERIWDPGQLVFDPHAVERVFRPGLTSVGTAAVLAPDVGKVFGITVADSSHWSATADGLTAAVPRIDQATPAVSNAPAVLVVERAAQPRWTVLAAASTTADTIQYVPNGEGRLPISGTIGSTARLVADASGSIFALFDPQNQRLLGFDPVARAWLQAAGTPSDVFARTGASLLLVGSKLFVVGGKVGSVLRTDGWIVDVFDGRAVSVPFGLPARQGARLFQTRDRNSVIALGGLDSVNKVHDDVWTIQLTGSDALLAHPLYADSSAAQQFDPATVLFGERSGSLVALAQGADGSLKERQRNSSGWTSAECPPRDLSNLTLYATSQLAVDDYARVLDGSGYATVGSAGTLGTNVGVWAQTGSILSSGNVVLRDNAHVNGDLWTAGVAQPQAGTAITGQLQEHAAISTSGLSCAVIPLPTSNSGNIVAQSGQTISLSAGSYGSVTINQSGTVKLVSGTYYLDSLSVEPQSTLSLDLTAGPIRIYVRTALAQRGKVIEVGGGAERLLVVYYGTSEAPVERSFPGTLVAPNGKVNLKTLADPGYVGGVFAKEVELGSSTRFSRNIFRGSWLP